jgi:hypothetical protein
VTTAKYTPLRENAAGPPRDWGTHSRRSTMAKSYVSTVNKVVADINEIIRINKYLEKWVIAVVMEHLRNGS